MATLGHESPVSVCSACVQVDLSRWGSTFIDLVVSVVYKSQCRTFSLGCAAAQVMALARSL